MTTAATDADLTWNSTTNTLSATNVSIAGTLTYEDVTNVDSIGVGTFRSGVIISGVTTVAAGSVSAPSITPSGDNNTGLFFPSADTIAFAEGGAEIARINSSGQLQMTGQFVSTKANDTATGGGQIFLNGATGNRIDFNGNGVAAPTTTTRSAGTKIVLYPGVSASNADYAFGIESNTLWSSVDTTTAQFKWYGAATLAATLTGTGNFTAVGNVTGYSDENLKDNVQTIPDALDKVTQLRGVEFDRNDIEGNPHQIGVIAQEVEKIIPEVVQTNGDGIKSVAYGNLVGLLIEAIKDLKEEVNELKARLEEV
jgi:hypothetical protein